MFSPEAGGAPILCPRLVVNGDFDDCFAFHLKEEKRRNQDSRCRNPDSHNHPTPGIPESRYP